jgi:hypothetical protein
MFIYNITYKVDWNINDVWLNWMLNEHMQLLTDAAGFTKFQLIKLHDVDEAEGPTYAAQYFMDNKDVYNRYLELHAAKFQTEMYNKWNDSVFSFKTLMEVIS